MPEEADGAAEEIDHNPIDHQAQQGDDVKRDTCLQSPIKHRIDEQQQQEATRQRMRPFAVQAYFFQSFQTTHYLLIASVVISYNIYKVESVCKNRINLTT